MFLQDSDWGVHKLILEMIKHITLRMVSDFALSGKICYTKNCHHDVFLSVWVHHYSYNTPLEVYKHQVPKTKP